MGFDKRLALEGIGDYLGKNSQVVLVKGGHWLPVEEGGSRALLTVAEWALGHELVPLKKMVGSLEGAKMLVDK
jgi:hypothetical protein